MDAISAICIFLHKKTKTIADPISEKAFTVWALLAIPSSLVYYINMLRS
jgi:hypothetical protein